MTERGNMVTAKEPGPSSNEADSLRTDAEQIAQMRTESVSESVTKMETTAIGFKGEIIEESIQMYHHTVNAICDMKKFAIENLSYFPTYMINKVESNVRDVLKFDAVSPNFNFSALSVGHFWAVVTLTVKCLGEVFASSYFGYQLLSFFFARTVLLVVLIYAALPALAIILNKKTSETCLTRADRRLLILLQAFVIGAGTHHVLLNWEQPEFAPPPFYSPVIVALLFEFVCPLFVQDRRLFLLSSVGVAGIICIAYGVEQNIFDFTYFYTSISAIVMSLYNMQLMMADPKQGWGDLIEGLILLPINSMYNQLVMTVLFGNYVPQRDRREAIPDSVEEQYSLLYWAKQ